MSSPAVSLGWSGAPGLTCRSGAADYKRQKRAGQSFRETRAGTVQGQAEKPLESLACRTTKNRKPEALILLPMGTAVVADEERCGQAERRENENLLGTAESDR